MGKKAKERLQTQQASRRRAILQIDKVSRRVDSTEDGPSSFSAPRAARPTSGMGLLGMYDDGSDDEVEPPRSSTAPTSSGNEASTSADIDMQVADFLKEIDAIPDTTSRIDSSDNTQLQDNVQTMDQEPDTTAVDVDSVPEQRAVPYPWEEVKDTNTNYSYYWNTLTNEVTWELPPDSYNQDYHPPEYQVAQADESERTVDAAQDQENNCVGSEDQGQPWIGIPEQEEDTQAPVTGEKDVPGCSDVNSQEEEPRTGYNASPENFNDKEEQDDEKHAEAKQEGPSVEEEAEVDGNTVADDNQVKEMKRPKTKYTENNAEVTASKKPKLDAETEDEFAERLLEEALEDGHQHDVLKEESMDMASDAEDEPESKQETLLPPSAFDSTWETPDDEEQGPVVSSKPVVKYDKQEEQSRTEILELAALLNNKLEFLEINKKKLTNFQILLIEIETRLKDWREGALETRHVLRKLREASQQFEEHELSVAPSGWKCLWDRTQRRYYYSNLTTGSSQWEYPTEAVETTASSTSASSTADTSLAAEQSNSVSSLGMSPWVVGTATMQAYLPAPSIPYHSAVMSVAMPTYSLSTMECSTTQDPYRTVKKQEAPEPPPPGHESPPPFPPGESPPPPPPEPDDDCEAKPPPPPPPGDDPPSSGLLSLAQYDNLSSLSAPSSRGLVDYSDLDAVSFTESNSGYTSPVSGTSSPLPNAMKTKSKKKKKEKSRVAGSSSTISSKAKKVSSLVQKWQTVKQKHEQEIAALAETDSEEEEDPETANQKKIEEWQKAQIESGMAASNPNFEQIQGDWREKLLARKRATTAQADS